MASAAPLNIAREAAAPLSPADINRLAREIVTAERGDRPAVTAVGNWSGYRTNSDNAEMSAMDRHFAILAAARAWDRRVVEVIREMVGAR